MDKYQELGIIPSHLKSFLTHLARGNVRKVAVGVVSSDNIHNNVEIVTRGLLHV